MPEQVSGYIGRKVENHIFLHIAIGMDTKNGKDPCFFGLASDDISQIK